MNNVLIGGIGNVLLGDDAFGPYVIHLLESQYTFADYVELCDLGTPALDLTHRIAGRYAVILVDCIVSDEYATGTVLAYDKADLLSAIPRQRLDPHSPAVSECLQTAEMLGASPEHVMLVGVVGTRFEPGRRLSEHVGQSVEKAVGAVLGELWRLGVKVERKTSRDESAAWWEQEESSLVPMLV